MERIDYRRAVGTDVWHWNPNCPNWPKQTFECTRHKPVTGEDCQQCGNLSDVS